MKVDLLRGKQNPASSWFSQWDFPRIQTYDNM